MVQTNKQTNGVYNTKFYNNYITLSLYFDGLINQRSHFTGGAPSCRLNPIFHTLTEQRQHCQ